MTKPNSNELIGALREAISWIVALRAAAPDAARVVVSDDVAEVKLERLRELSGYSKHRARSMAAKGTIPPIALERVEPTVQQIERLAAADMVQRRREAAEILADQLAAVEQQPDFVDDLDADTDVGITTPIDDRFDRSSNDA